MRTGAAQAHVPCVASETPRRTSDLPPKKFTSGGWRSRHDSVQIAREDQSAAHCGSFGSICTSCRADNRAESVSLTRRFVLPRSCSNSPLGTNAHSKGLEAERCRAEKGQTVDHRSAVGANPHPRPLDHTTDYCSPANLADNFLPSPGREPFWPRPRVGTAAAIPPDTR